MSDSKALVFSIAKTMAEHKAGDVVILDLRGIADWTDYFVIGTSGSSTHLSGLVRAVEEEIAAEAITTINKPSIKDDENWVLLDIGDIVVHIMSQTARSFYELEKLWFKAPQIQVEAR
ncbi:MAG: ribosome silencing factor [Spirochaetaceae bacterium]|nr:ribosome silencing factor [Spirochaetaceae bacterium]